MIFGATFALLKAEITRLNNDVTRLGHQLASANGKVKRCEEEIEVRGHAFQEVTQKLLVREKFYREALQKIASFPPYRGTIGTTTYERDPLQQIATAALSSQRDEGEGREKAE